MFGYKYIIHYRKMKFNDKKQALKNGITILILFFLAFLICASLSSYIIYPKNPHLDSSVFRYVGMVMKNGGVPYRDTFDHKGPLIYFINYFGLYFGKNGVWFIEFLLMFVAVVFTYRTMRLFCKQPLSLIGTSIILSFMYDYLGEGNYTEEYALPFIFCSIYIFADYFLSGKTERWKLMLCGACAMAVLLLRANMIGTWLVFPVAVIIKEIRNKSKKLFSLILFFVIGAMCVLLPFLIYFAINGALKDFWEQYIIFNFDYSSATGSKGKAILHYMFTTPCLSACLLSIVSLLNKKSREILDWSNLAYIAVSVYMISISGRTYNHYGLILVPLMVIPTARLYQFLYSKKNKLILMVCSIGMMVILSIPWLNVLVSKHIIAKSSDQTVEGIIASFIKDNTDEKDLIIQCGHKDIFYVLSDRMAASKYSYPLPIAQIDDRVYDFFFNDLKKNNPTIIIADSWTEQDQLDYTEMNKRLQDFVNEFGYVKGPSLKTYSLYFSKDSDLASKWGEIQKKTNVDINSVYR